MNLTSAAKRKIPLINSVSIFLICLLLVTYTIPGFSDWRDPAVIIAGGIGGGLAIGGAIATAPAWGIAGGVLAIGAAGIALWDYLDGPDKPEDNCPDCDGSGYYNGDPCNTCNAGGNDTCQDCPGSGCSTCTTAETCSICDETFYGTHSCDSGYDYTPSCDYCTAGCSSCSIGQGGSSGSYYSY